jgi:hypothetical protein
MAKTLARSLLVHSPDISRAIVTDCQDDSELISLFDYLIPLRAEYGSNVRQKLFLNRYSPFERTLYIDSDCIVIRNINFVFQKFAGKAFSTVGEQYLNFGDEDKFLNLSLALEYFKLSRIPKFNGGIYYFEKTKDVESIFLCAQDILDSSKKLGFVDFRGDGPADEPIFAISMALHNQEMLDEADHIMRTTIGLRGKLHLSVFEGQCEFQKYDRKVSPAIVHFPHIWAEHPTYRREAMKLQQEFASTFPSEVEVSFFDDLRFIYHYGNYAFKSIKRKFNKKFT